MKFSSQEEYGLRCMLQIARRGEGATMTIPEISNAEGLSIAHVAKLMRILRLGGFVESERGQAGGYFLARTPVEINVGELLSFLGGRLVENDFCSTFKGVEQSCTHSVVDCSVLSLWNMVQTEVDKVLGTTTLHDLLLAKETHTEKLWTISVPKEIEN